MRILVINSGSSSMKFSIYEIAATTPASEPTALLAGEISGIGGANPSLGISSPGAPAEPTTRSAVVAGDAAAAAGLILDAVTKPEVPKFEAVGYRVVHPGSELVGHQRLTPEVLSELHRAISLAPLHDPAVLSVIGAAMQRFPNLAHFACFDTEFHRTMPEEASVYAIPKRFRDAGVRRYGFHGLSCESVVYQLRGRHDLFPQRLVIAHLGSGCSVTAVQDGRSVDTSMGLTPEGGVVMGTRPGDLDPGLILYLLRQQKPEGSHAVDAVESLLNHNSGMVALSGLENNMQATRQAAAGGNIDAVLALRVFTRSVRKTIGGFAWLLGGLDAIVFTGGIGEHDPDTRRECLIGLDAMHIALDASRNSGGGNGIRDLQASDSETSVLVVPAQEDLMIAMHVARMAQADN